MKFEQILDSAQKMEAKIESRGWDADVTFSIPGTMADASIVAHAKIPGESRPVHTLVVYDALSIKDAIAKMEAKIETLPHNLFSPPFEEDIPFDPAPVRSSEAFPVLMACEDDYKPSLRERVSTAFRSMLPRRFPRV